MFPSKILKNFHPKVHSRSCPPRIVPAKFSNMVPPQLPEAMLKNASKLCCTQQAQVLSSLRFVNQPIRFAKYCFKHFSTTRKGKRKRNVGRDALPKLSMIHLFRCLTEVIRGEESHSIYVLVFFGTLPWRRMEFETTISIRLAIVLWLTFSPTKFIHSKRKEVVLKNQWCAKKTQIVTIIIIIILDDNVNFKKSQNVWQSESLRVGRVGKLLNIQWYDSITLWVTWAAGPQEKSQLPQQGTKMMGFWN